MLHILVLHFLQCCTGAWLVVEVGVSVVGTTTTLARGRDLVGRGGGHSSSSVVVNQPQFWYIEHPPRPFHGSIQAIFRTKRLIDSGLGTLDFFRHWYREDTLDNLPGEVRFARTVGTCSHVKLYLQRNCFGKQLIKLHTHGILVHTHCVIVFQNMPCCVKQQYMKVNNK